MTHVPTERIPEGTKVAFLNCCENCGASMAAQEIKPALHPCVQRLVDSYGWESDFVRVRVRGLKPLGRVSLREERPHLERDVKRQ